MEAFGGRNNLTPNMDRLAREGLLFTRMYATGTRTVRGLEAVTLSMPPGPGHSIVKRADNAGLFNIGAVFRDHGYDSLYVYGGYAYFDNMQAFYQGSGYTVVDRLAVAKKDIHHENIWGIADEDLFTLTLRELDQRHADGHKVFAHVMTTSNHRPYTYPNGRIDLPSKSSGRDGGVKYTDWAIGDFIERARAKPWFNDTMFVFVADHTHNGRGKTELPPENYHIPMIVYAPAHIPAGRVDAIASQIDTAPTILGLLNFNYESLFFGHDILKPGPEGERAFLSNYQTVGMYKNGRIVELRPKKRVRVVDAMTHHEVEGPEAAALIEEAIAYYQTSSWAFHSGELRAIAHKPKVRLPPS
jgi:phosphoglycerol transferase MdoB-like AlkP superfamily enzyme